MKSVVLSQALFATLKGVGKFGGGESWTESDVHHTLVLGPGDHIQATNTVSQLVYVAYTIGFNLNIILF